MKRKDETMSEPIDTLYEIADIIKAVRRPGPVFVAALGAFDVMWVEAKKGNLIQALDTMSGSDFQLTVHDNGDKYLDAQSS